MTIPELAQTAGCSEHTVKRWIAANMPGRMVKGQVTRLTFAEATAAMEALPKRNMVGNSGQLSKVNLGQMAQEPKPNGAGLDVAAIVRETIQALLPAIVAAVRGEPNAPQRAALPAPAPLELRDELRKIATNAGKVSGDFRGAWGQLYQEIYYRLHRNIRECAKHRGIDALDYIEEEGLLPDVLAIAREIFR